MAIKKESPVDSELNQKLDEITGLTEKVVAGLAGQDLCTWYQNCYYCKLNGRWYLQYCNA